MFLNLKHTRLDVFSLSRKLVVECYRITNLFPAEEKFGMTSQIRRAALSVHLNIAEGCSRKSAVERNRFFEIARGSVVEIDTAFDIALELHYTNKEHIFLLGEYIVQVFKLLSGLITNSTTDK